MPGFTIRRKKKAAPAPPPQDKKTVAEELSESMESASLSDNSEDAYIEERLNEAKQQYRPQPQQRQPQYRQQRHVHFQQPPNPASQHPNIAPQQYYRRPQPHITDPYRRKPTMRVPPKPQWGRKSSAGFQYRSHYGPNGAALPTQQKAMLLYTHCFG